VCLRFVSSADQRVPSHVDASAATRNSKTAVDTLLIPPLPPLLYLPTISFPHLNERLCSCTSNHGKVLHPRNLFSSVENYVRKLLSEPRVVVDLHGVWELGIWVQGLGLRV